MYRLYRFTDDPTREAAADGGGRVAGEHPDLAFAQGRARKVFEGDASEGERTGRVEAHDAEAEGRSGQPPALTFFPDGRTVGPWHRLRELEGALDAARGRRT